MAKPREAEPEAAVAPRLYLVAPADMPPAELAAALEAAEAACVLLREAGLDEAALRAGVAALRPPAQARGVAVLLADRAGLAAETGCDGVHLSGPGALAAARRRLGAEAIVGVGCGGSRHDAILAAEQGADYVAFGAPEPAPQPADAELLGWWQLLMTLPCVAFGAADARDCARLAAAGADFVAVGPGMDLAACRKALETAAR